MAERTSRRLRLTFVLAAGIGLAACRSGTPIGTLQPDAGPRLAGLYRLVEGQAWYRFNQDGVDAGDGDADGWRGGTYTIKRDRLTIRSTDGTGDQYFVVSGDCIEHASGAQYCLVEE